MKRTTLTGIILTLWMFLLVAVAAFFFLFQAQQTLQQEVLTLEAGNSTLEASIGQMGVAYANAEGTRTAVTASLATMESNAVLLEGQLVANEQKTTSLTNELGTRTAELAAANNSLNQLELTQQQAGEHLPVVKILSPEDKAIVPPAIPLSIVIAASDSDGITAVSLQINDAPPTSYPANGETLFTLTKNLTPAKGNRYTLTVTATNSNGRISTPVVITVDSDSGS